jgi:phospholipid/cholesterol/gamma-HCH transport system substrate-binding protein
MDDKVNHTLVGAFVLLLGAALMAGILWLAAGLNGRQSMDAYQGVIQESGAGLSIDSPVKYLGVDVGRVDRIEIDPANTQQVRLHFMVVQGTPIKRDSVAVLKTQGLTGMAYVELNGGSESSPPLRAGADGVAPTIPFKPSLAARLENVLSTVLGNVDRVSDNLNAVLDDDNRAALKSALADVAGLARSLAGRRAVLEAGLNDASRAAARTARAAERLEPTLERIATSAQAVEKMADAAQSASVRAGDAADAATLGVRQLGSQTLPDLARLMAELNQLAASMRQLSDQTAASPSSLLVGQPPPQPGPGETAP